LTIEESKGQRLLAADRGALHENLFSQPEERSLTVTDTGLPLMDDRKAECRHHSTSQATPGGAD